MPSSTPLPFELPPDVVMHRDLEFVMRLTGPMYLDLYLPANAAKPTPLVIFMFGGAWMQNDKLRVQEQGGLDVLEHGYAVAAVNYRLTDVATWPAQIMDVKAAIAWLRIHAAEYGLDPERFATRGASSGGHLASMAGLADAMPEWEPPNIEQAGPLGSRVQAVVNFFGPTDFLQMDTHALPNPPFLHDDPQSPESKLVGGPIQDNQAQVQAANPINYIGSTVPPFLTVHGDQDMLVPHHQSVLLHEALAAVNADVTFYTVEGGGHGHGGEFGSTALISMVVEFLRTKL
ncbi:MAG: alpha/beta hydrolase [Pseudomonadota bacterium]